MMTCDDFDFDCTGWHPNIPALPAQPDPDGWVWYQGDSTIWIDNGGFPLCPGQVMNDVLAEINWSVEEQGDVSGYPICYNLDPIYAEWEECGCDDGPGARRCNLGWCDLVCAELTKDECQLIDFHDHDHSPGNVGCYWSETSPRGCRSHERNYLTTTECNQINGIGECGSGVPDGQECNYCVCDMHWNSNCSQSQTPDDYCRENCADNNDNCGGFGSGCQCSIDNFFGGGVGPGQLADPNNEGLYAGICPPGYAWSGVQGQCVWQGGSTELE